MAEGEGGKEGCPLRQPGQVLPCSSGGESPRVPGSTDRSHAAAQGWIRRHCGRSQCDEMCGKHQQVGGSGSRAQEGDAGGCQPPSPFPVPGEGRAALGRACGGHRHPVLFCCAFESGCVRQRKDDTINVERQSGVYLQHGPM